MKSNARLAPGGPVHRALEGVFDRCDVAASVARDPIGIVRRYRNAANELDLELVALVAGCVAFGNVKALVAKLEDALGRIGPSPSSRADDEDGIHARLATWKHRVYKGEDLARLVVGARRVQRQNDSLGGAFAVGLARSEGDVREALALFVDQIRHAGGLDRSRSRGARHLLPDPRGSSGCKRLLLFLRWMVRGPDAIDLGIWRKHFDPSLLLVPVDVHIHKLSKNLGLTRRKGTSWKTTLEITDALRRFDAGDPVRFDFALCHMGMLQRCPSRRDPKRCEGCPVKPVCGAWT